MSPTPLFLEWLFGGVFGFVLCRVWYWIASERPLDCLNGRWGWLPVFDGVLMGWWWLCLWGGFGCGGWFGVLWYSLTTNESGIFRYGFKWARNLVSSGRYLGYCLWFFSRFFLRLILPGFLILGAFRWRRLGGFQLSSWSSLFGWSPYPYWRTPRQWSAKDPWYLHCPSSNPCLESRIWYHSRQPYHCLGDWKRAMEALNLIIFHSKATFIP